MKLCVTSQGKDSDSTVDMRFGRCGYLLFIDGDGGIIESMQNPGRENARGAGIKTAQSIIDKEAKVVITGKVGPNAAEVLKSSNIKMFIAEDGLSVKEAVDLYRKGNLREYNF